MKKIPTLLLISSGVAFFILGSAFFLVDAQQETVTLTDQVRTHAPGKFIKLKEGIVHYTLQGSDTARLLVFIHGGGASGMEVWSEVIPYFVSHGFRVLAYDLYGRGYSHYPAIANTTELFGKQLNDLIDTLQLQSPFDIVSMSMGSIIALDFANQHPEKINHLVFIDPAATGDFKLNKLLRLPVVSRLLMTMYWYPRTIQNQRKDFVNREVFDRYAQRLAYFMNFKGFKATNYSTWTNVLHQNKLPLLKLLPPNKAVLIYGKQDPYFTTELAERYRSVYPSLKMIEIDSAGHIPHMEKPKEVNRAIMDFLNTSKEIH